MITKNLAKFAVFFQILQQKVRNSQSRVLDPIQHTAMSHQRLVLPNN